MLTTSDFEDVDFKLSLSPPVTQTAEVVVGWPPVRKNRKRGAKVGMDGAPYLRKVDLEAYESYEQLLKALETMFCCSTIILRNENKLMMDYMATYEDKEGDWMLLGYVPWKMFVESCKRIRLMIK